MAKKFSVPWGHYRLLIDKFKNEPEKAKIECAEKLFNDASTSKVGYHKVDSYETFLNIIKGIDR